MKKFSPRGASDRGPRSRPAGPRSSSPRGAGAAYPARDKVLFAATCNACGKSCQVPFEPNGRKPVYCRECFIPKEEKAERGERVPFKSSSKFGAGKFDSRRSDDRGASRTMYPRPEARVATPNDGLAKQLSDLHSKVDLLTKMIKELSL